MTFAATYSSRVFGYEAAYNPHPEEAARPSRRIPPFHPIKLNVPFILNAPASEVRAVRRKLKLNVPYFAGERSIQDTSRSTQPRHRHARARPAYPAYLATPGDNGYADQVRA